VERIKSETDYKMSAQLSYLVEHVLENFDDEALIDRLLITKTSVADFDQLKDMFEVKVSLRKLDLYRLGRLPIQYRILRNLVFDDEYEYIIKFEGKHVSNNIRTTIEGLHLIPQIRLSGGWIQLNNGINTIEIHESGYTILSENDEPHIEGQLFITECIPK
jgi:hypothetical protein